LSDGAAFKERSVKRKACQLVTILLILLVLLVAAWFIASGTEYAYLIGALGIVLLFVLGLGDHVWLLPQSIFSRLDVFTLMALPMFILAAEIMNRGGVTTALVDFAMRLTGRAPGALGNVNVMTAVFFGGVSGSAIADAAALSSTMVPVMRDRGYTPGYAAAITASAAIIGPIIPPSIILILYGALMEVDISALFAAGIIPGLLIASLLMIANTIIAIRHNHPRGDGFSLITMVKAIPGALPALALPAVILGGVVVGVVTPTEAGALAVLAAWLASSLYRPLGMDELGKAIAEAAMLTGAMLVLMATSGLLSYLSAITGFAAGLTSLLQATGLIGLPYLALVILVLLIAGMFTGVRLSLFVIVPLVVPAAVAQGFDPVHLGIVICLTLTIGLITPPFGPVLLVTSAVTGIPVAAFLKYTMGFTVLIGVALALLVLVPDLVLALPRMMGLL
jgi:tripartite ATP-independent transporter DctM subunit